MNPKKLLSLIPVMLMALLLTLTFAPTASAETTEKAVALGTAALSGYDSASNSYKYIYYDTFESNPIKWHILAMNGNDGTYTPANGETPSTWSPIGYAKRDTTAAIGSEMIYVYYTGTFDGNGKTVSGLKVNATGYAAGLFGCVGGGARIKDLTVKNSYFFGLQAGTIVGDVRPEQPDDDNRGALSLKDKISSVSITDCHVEATVCGFAGVGGIVG